MSTQIKRLEFDELTSGVQNVLSARVKRLGYLGEFFKCTGHQPDVLVPFMEMTAALTEALPARLTELGALTVATLMSNDYERHQHERLSLKLGFEPGWVAAVEMIAPDTAPELADDERVVQRLIVAMVEGHGIGTSRLVQAALDVLGQEHVIAILFLVGRYMTHAMIVNALELAPPVPSPLPVQAQS